MSDFIFVETFQTIQKIHLGNPENNIILGRFAAVVSDRGADAAIFTPDGGVARTFRQIDEEAWRWAEVFHRRDDADDPRADAAGGTVALQAGNVPEWPALLLGAWRAGLCVIPMDFDLTGARRDRVEEICGVSQRIGWRDGNLVIEATGFTDPLNGGTHLMKLTSGTTGDPRAIRFTADQLLADCDNVCETMGLREDDVNYGVISFSHSYGFSNLVTPLLCRGIPLVVSADAIPRAMVDGIVATGTTVLPGAPAHFRALSGLRAGAGSLRLCISAGAPLASEIAAGFLGAWGRKVHSFYGASECGGICYDAGDETNRPAGFVGRPLRGVALEPFEPCDAPSRMRVRSGAVGSGYFPADDADLAAGVFQPADLLEWRGDGYVITGRISDLINVAGRKVNPAEIEEVLRMCPGVDDVVVLGIPTGLRGEDVAACVVGGAVEETLRIFCAERLAGWQVPRRWFFLPEIPANARGKISRADLRRRITSSG